jgi:hypothetical protein
LVMACWMSRARPQGTKPQTVRLLTFNVLDERIKHSPLSHL